LYRLVELCRRETQRLECYAFIDWTIGFLHQSLGSVIEAVRQSDEFCTTVNIKSVWILRRNLGKLEMAID
jgi:hypothetical protein